MLLHVMMQTLMACVMMWMIALENLMSVVYVMAMVLLMAHVTVMVTQKTVQVLSLIHI